MPEELPALYKPKGATSLKDAIQAQIRLGIQGAPSTGKTWSGLTFPYCDVLNLDRGLGAHIGKEHITELKFYDIEWTKTNYPVPNLPPEEARKDAIIKFLETEAQKYTYQQTLMIDGSTGLQNLWNNYTRVTRFITKGGKDDDFMPWRLKQEYFTTITELYKSLKCNVIYLAHESERRDKPASPGQLGEYSGKIRPLLTGQFADELVGHFTDWFRQFSATKPTDFSNVSDDKLRNWGCKNVADYKAMFEEHWPNIPTIYYWQTYGDDVFDAKVSSLINQPKFIPANYKSFLKYTKQNQLTIK